MTIALNERVGVLERVARYQRKTNETAIEVRVNLDGAGVSSILTGIGFLDHMFTAFSRHSGIDITLACDGDLHVDCHHTAEDCAMVKLYCSEMLSRIADQALQTVGGMGLMEELPLERIWRDARIERIWDGTSEIQRHIISRGLLRPLGA